MEPVRIIDMIRHTNAYGHVSWYVVLNRQPILKYRREGNWLVGQDGVVWDSLAIEPGSTNAFGGRKFSLQMEDGSAYECHGQAWAAKYPGFTECAQVGIGTVESLGKCNVFSAAYIELDAMNAWLAEHKPSRNYSKYEKTENPEYWWSLCLDEGWIKRVSKQRAATMRKHGRRIGRDQDGTFWCPVYENWAAQIRARAQLDMAESA